MIKLNPNDINELTEEQLKEIILLYYYPDLKQYPKDSNMWKTNIARKLFKAKLHDNYTNLGTIIYSIEGSPAKGRAVLMFNNNTVCADMVMFGNNKTSKKYKVVIIEES